MQRKIIIDTDPGQDDAVAILLALASPGDFDVLGIVTVAGNVELDQTTRNALRIVELSGRREIPVYAGCDRPIRRPLQTAKHVHGKTGLDGPSLPAPTSKPQPTHGVDFIVGALRVHEPGEVTMVTLGPLTNLAMALAKAPDIAPRIKEIVMMAGAYFEVGNFSPAAEFNVFVDPEAADIVLRAGIPIIQASLDVSHQVLTTVERLEEFRALGNKTGVAVADMLAHSQTFDLTKYGGKGAPLHDPCTIAWLLEPDLFEGRLINVSVETSSELTRGMTVADFWRITDRPKNSTWLRHVDAPGFYALLTERLRRLP